MENAVKKSYISNVGNGRVTFIGNDSTAAAMASISQVYEREAEEYMELNDIAEKNLEENGVVIMGSTFAKEMPVGTAGKIKPQHKSCTVDELTCFKIER